MTPELIAIVTVGVALAGVGVALAGVILTSIRGVRQDMARLESRLDGKIDALSAQLGDTPRTHGAPGRADGRLARSDHPPGQSQLVTAGWRGINRPYKKKPTLARGLWS